MKFGSPLSLPAQGQFTEGQVDELFNGVGTGLTFVQEQITTVNSYTAIAVRLPTAGNPVCYYGQIQDATAPVGGGNHESYVAAAGITPAGASAADQQILIPCNNSPGDLLFLTVDFAGAFNNSQDISVYGLTGPRIVSCRTDGRAYPIGRFANSAVQNGAGTTNLAAALPGLRYLIKAVSYSATAAVSGPTVTVNGATYNLVQLVASFAGSLEIPPDGILCDVDSAIALTSIAGDNIAGSILYDIVV